MKNNLPKKLTALAVLAVMAAVFALSLPSAVKNAAERLKYIGNYKLSESVKLFEKGYDSSLSDNSGWLELYGGFQRLLQKREVGDFDVVRDSEDSLYQDFTRASADYTSSAQQSALSLYSWAQNSGTAFLYLTVPWKTTEDRPELNGYLAGNALLNTRDFLAGISGSGMPVLELKAELPGLQYFRTDHHWTLPTALDAARLTVARVNELYGLGITSAADDDTNFNTLEYDSSFLGSYGIRVGSLYAGRDDFDIPVPSYSTDFDFVCLAADGTETGGSGDFFSALFDRDILDDAGYNNKYNAPLYGCMYEGRAVNKDPPNELKVLYVGSSYGRVLAPYLALYFAETRFIDASAGRWSGDITAYCEEYQPDVIILMSDFPFNTGE